MRRHAPISSVYRLGQSTPTLDPDKAFARNWNVMRTLWQERGVVAIYPADLPESLQHGLIDWANKNYGERKR